MLECKTCKIKQPESFFYKKSIGGKVYLRRNCIACERVKARVRARKKYGYSATVTTAEFKLAKPARKPTAKRTRKSKKQAAPKLTNQTRTPPTPIEQEWQRWGFVVIPKDIIN